MERPKQQQLIEYISLSECRLAFTIEQLCWSQMNIERTLDDILNDEYLFMGDELVITRARILNEEKKLELIYDQLRFTG